MYANDLLTMPGTWLRRVRVWYARGRTWGPSAHQVSPLPAVRPNAAHREEEG